MKAIILWLCLINISYCDDIHWAVGGWDCRSWGAIRLFDVDSGRWALDLSPDGDQQDWGVWQEFSQDSIIIIWMDSSRMEVIMKSDDRYFHQMAYAFGISSHIEPTKKTIIQD
jgi:hypothetical protein